jgi:hypothetical protein
LERPKKLLVNTGFDAVVVPASALPVTYGSVVL